MATVTKKETTAAAETTATKEKMVKIYLPRINPKEPDLFVSCNGRTWKIMRGVEVEVPECAANIIYEKQELAMKAYDRIAALSKG